MNDTGVLYVATGQRYVDEAVAAAASLRRWHPDLPTALFTDLVDNVPQGAFTEVHAVPEQVWVKTEAKVWAVQRSPFERTLYLDTDTFVCGDLTGCFRVLDRFDVAAVPADTRLTKHPLHADPADVPDAFQTVNGGLLSFRRGPATQAFLEHWWSLYQADKASARNVRDQPSLRVALWRSSCQMIHLPPEYNMRTNRFRNLPRTAVGQVRIIHGRPRSLPRLERRWNARTEPRLLTPLTQFAVRSMYRRVARGRHGQVVTLNRRFRKWRQSLFRRRPAR